jgi:hypothetical protein
LRCRRGCTEIGFVLPKSAQARGRRDGDPRIAAPLAHDRTVNCIERLDRRVAP